MTRAFETVVEDGIAVSLPSGANFSVMTRDEVDYVTDRVARYLKDNHFVNISDLQDVDRMVMMEVLVHRWSLWLSRQKDYFGDDIDEKQLQRIINEYSTEIRLLKKQLGIDKVARDKAKGDDSVGEYLANLRIRAKQFGVMRENQLAKALELFNQLKMLVTLYHNTDEIERREMNCDLPDIIEWLDKIAFPEFDIIDEHFRHNEQRTWIRSQ